MDRWQRGQVALGGLIIGGLLTLGAVMPEQVAIPETAQDVEACMQEASDWRECSANWEAYSEWASEDDAVGDFGDVQHDQAVEQNRLAGGCERRWEDGSVSIIPCPEDHMASPLLGDIVSLRQASDDVRRALDAVQGYRAPEVPEVAMATTLTDDAGTPCIVEVQDVEEDQIAVPAYSEVVDVTRVPGGLSVTLCAT